MDNRSQRRVVTGVSAGCGGCFRGLQCDAFVPLPLLGFTTLGFQVVIVCGWLRVNGRSQLH